MSENLELRAYKGYHPNDVRELFESRGWYSKIITPEQAGLVRADMGAAIMCIDGRHGLGVDTTNGPKLPGAGNGIAALLTGGDMVGMNAAAKFAEDNGYRFGTHRDCGMWWKWANGELETAIYPFDPSAACMDKYEDLGELNRMIVRLKNGKHFLLNGQHQEQALIFNPYEDTTTISRPDRFAYDHWLLKRALNGNGRRAKHFVAEVVEKLKPDAMKVEIIAA